MISVIIPFYNAEKYLNESIESILNQTLDDFELILIDDMSTDSSYKIAEKYTGDSRVVLVKNKNQKGVSGARNHGLEIAKGEFIANMDADDIALPMRLEKQRQFLQSHPEIGVVGTLLENFGAAEGVWDMPEHDDDLKALFILYSPIPNPAAMFRRSLVEEHQIWYRSEYDGAEDYEFWLQLMPYTKFSIIQEPLVKYRIHSGSMSTAGREKQVDAWKRALRVVISEFRFEDPEAVFGTLNLLEGIDYQAVDSVWKQQAVLHLELLIDQNNQHLVFPKIAFQKLLGNIIAELKK